MSERVTAYNRDDAKWPTQTRFEHTDRPRVERLAKARGMSVATLLRVLMLREVEADEAERRTRQGAVIIPSEIVEVSE